MEVSITTVRTLLVAFFLLFLAVVFLKERQTARGNWAVFYSALWVLVNLGFVNYLSVEWGCWHFVKDNAIHMPVDLYFIWFVIWGVIPVYFFKGRYRWIIALVFFWIDILFMPLLEKYGVLKLNDSWLLGEVALIVLVFLPSYWWAFLSLIKKRADWRAVFQICIMTVLFVCIVPFTLFQYGLIEQLKFTWEPYLFQFTFILVFPALAAVQALVTQGKGTPFPYDETRNLVRTGVYAYCRNPIQWSFTLMFVPLSIHFSSYYFLLGSLVSVAYVVGVSDVQEYPDMEKRFGKDWSTHLQSVPKWMFLWKPIQIPKGTIYFDADCTQCSQIRAWFSKLDGCNLELKKASDYPGAQILQVTYVDHNGTVYKSVKAIASALGHVNLAWASLGWFMLMPGISLVLQAIVDSMRINIQEDACDLNNN